MRVELLLPILIAVVLGLLGAGLVFDAWTPDEIIVRRDRRRSPRAERNRSGEAWIGFGVLSMAAAFAGRDSWRYSVVAVIAGTAFLVYGAILNRTYFAELITNRGALRRRDVAAPAKAQPRQPTPDPVEKPAAEPLVPPG